MSDIQSEHQEFSLWIEKVILSIFLVFGKMFKTALDFTMFPTKFSRNINVLNPVSPDLTNRYARPLSYLFFSLLVAIFGFYLLTEAEYIKDEAKTSNFFLILLIGGIKEGNFVTLA